MTINSHPSSFRDPEGKVFIYNNNLYRGLSPDYCDDYDYFISSGLYDELKTKGLIVSHEETSIEDEEIQRDFAKVLKPKKVSFVSYPYEWTFDQMKSAALATLKIMKISLKKGMILKDASAYNILFDGPNPVFIDTSSFKRYEEGSLWTSYYQFCRHFLAPLVFMSYHKEHFGAFLKQDLDGMSLSLVSRSLPATSWLSPSVLGHIHLHSKVESSKKTSEEEQSKANLPKAKLVNLVNQLIDFIQGLEYSKTETTWSDYYEDIQGSYDNEKEKYESVTKLLEGKTWDVAADFGANTGKYSELLSRYCNHVIALEQDILCAERMQKHFKKNRFNNITPIVMNLSNPSPAIGWALQERPSLFERSNFDLGIALAVIHHLIINTNLNMDNLSLLFSNTCKELIIEYVDVLDPRSQKMIKSQEKGFINYNIEEFEEAFKKNFDIKEKIKVNNFRTLYFMRRKS